MKILTTHKQADVFVASNDTETRTLLLIIIIHNELTNFVQHLLQLIIRLIASRYLPRLLERNSMRNLVEGQRSCFYRATVLEVFWFFHLLSQKWFLLSKTKSLTFNVHVCFCYKIACQRPPRNTLETLDQKNCFEEQNILGRLVLIIKSNSVSSPKSDSQWNSIQKSRLLSKVFALGRYFRSWVHWNSLEIMSRRSCKIISIFDTTTQIATICYLQHSSQLQTLQVVIVQFKSRDEIEAIAKTFFLLLKLSSLK